MEAFVWDKHFVTGLETVDVQHHHLVDIVNQLGDTLIAAAPEGKASVEAIFHQLADYAHTHFRDEERLMQEAGVAAGHYDHHVGIHRDFVTQVLSMWRARGSMVSPAEALHGFLASWLSFHILGEDQAMAREIARIHAGMPPAEAHRLEAERDEDSSAAALLRALQNLYGVLAHMNRDLAETNLHLEEQVAKRTRELVQSEKMASVGQLAAGVAHEINNPIGFVNSNLGTLGRYVDELLRFAELGAATPPGQALGQKIDLGYLRTDLADLLRESQEGLERVRRIVASLKDFARLDEAEWQQADPLAGLESALAVASHVLQKARIVRALAPLPALRCMPAQLNQLFLNLLTNAAQAIGESGTITLRSGTENGAAWIAVEDDGCGMDAATLQRAFEPFFTTRPVGSGMGLGLAAAYDIAAKHGGRIEAASTPGKGTRMRVTLPLAGPPGGGSNKG